MSTVSYYIVLSVFHTYKAPMRMQAPFAKPKVLKTF